VRVAIVTETFLPQVNGVVRMLVEYLAYLEAHGHDAVVFAPGEGGSGDESCHSFDVLRVRGAALPLYPELTLAPYSRRMHGVLREWRPDVVHLAGPFVLGAQGLSVARALGVPVAAHYQTDLARYAEHFGLGALTGLAWRRLLGIHNGCDVTFAPTSSVARDLRERGMRRVHICGRGVDTTAFHPMYRDTTVRKRFGGGSEAPLMLYVGRLSPEKNLAALVAVARALPAYPLVIVGDGPMRGELAAQLDGLNVHFTGTLRGQALAAAYAAADLFLFPSQTETFGQVVREAMASGLPTVGIRAGGVRDLVADGRSGLLCPPDDTPAFVDAARTIAADPDLRYAMGAAARREAEGHTWASIFDRLMGWYAGIATPQHVAISN